MSSKTGNKKVAKTRSKAWNDKLIHGHEDAKLHPSIIRTRRIKSSISQKTLADLLKVSVSTYGSIERGKRMLKKEHAMLLSKVLKLNFNQVFNRVKSNKFLANKV